MLRKGNIFEGYQLRGTTSYLDLSKHEFSAEEKLQFLHLLESEKENGKPISRTALCAKYNISRTMTSNWSSTVEKKHVLHSTTGRPSRFDDEAKNSVLEQMVTLGNAMEVPTVEEVDMMLDKAAKDTDKRRGQVNPSPCMETKASLKKELGIQEINPQSKVEELHNMKSHVEEEDFRIHGQLMEEQMDQSGIPTVENGRQENTTRILLVGIDQAIMQIADPVERQAVQQCAKLVEQAEKRKEMKRKKLEREATMSVEEIRAEKESKKKLRAERKAAKQAAVAYAYQVMANISKT